VPPGSRIEAPGPGWPGPSDVRDPDGMEPGEPSGDEPEVPLAALLARAWIAFAIEADNAAEAAAAGQPVGRLFRVSLAMWANGLRLIGEDGISAGELRTRARAACNVGGLERWGWITVGDPAAGRRDGYGTHRGVTAATVLRPTRAGRFARRLWPQVIAETEQRWQNRFGAGPVGSLRQALRPHAGLLPYAPPEVHPSDGFRTSLIDGPATAEENEESLAGLLGQALTSLTAAHERGSRESVPLGANFLRVIGGSVTRMAGLPALAGVSREAVAMATGYLTRHKLAEPGPQRSVTLTAAGRRALGDYRTRAAGQQDPALRASVEAVASQRAALAEGLVPPDGCWRGEKPYLAQTRRLIADPAAALPWQPMVLHRGGWPDGS
jgi:hypothetical protein